MSFEVSSSVEELGLATLRATHRFRIASPRLQPPLIVDVAEPMFPLPPGRKLPVVYLLDGAATFPLAAETARMLQLGPGALPPMLIVGVGYEMGAGPAEFGRFLALRNRDFTFSTDADFFAKARSGAAGPPWPDGVEPGGGEAFHAVLTEEVMPLIASRFGADPEDQTLVGCSFGGLFVLHALFRAPETFKRAVAISPSIWWGGRDILEVEREFAQRARDLPVRLSLLVGEKEEAEDATARMVSNMVEFASRLRERNYPGLRLTEQILPGETHMSVAPAAICRGLRAVFA